MVFGKLLKKGRSSEIEGQLKEALGKESWGASNSLLQELALATEDDAHRQEVLQAVWKVLDDGKQWRRVLKALALSEAILKRGSVRAVEDVKKEMHRIQRWRNHQQQEEGRDVAGGIREKANNIVQLLENPKQLNQERQKNYELYAKLEGVGTEVKERVSVADKAMSFAKKTKDTVTGNNEAEVEREAAKHQREVQMFLAVQEFVSKTGAPDHVARHFLRRHRGNMHAATAEFAATKGGASATGGATPRAAGAAPAPQQKPGRPSFSQARAMCEQVKMIAEISDGEAAKILEQCGWDVEKAIDKASQQAPAAKAPQPDSDSDDSDSDSDSSDDESQASPVNNRGGQGGGWPAGQQQATTPRAGQQGAWGFGGQQQGFGGPQGGFGGQQGNQQRGFNGNNNTFGAQGGFGGPQQGGFGGQQGNQQVGWGGQQGGFGGQQQQGGWQGNQQAGRSGQQSNQQGGWAGQQSNPQGGWGGQQSNQQGGWGGQQSNQQGGWGNQQGNQQGGFGGQQGFQKQQAGYPGQNGGFNGPQAGFGGQQGNGFGGNPFGGNGAGSNGGGFAAKAAGYGNGFQNQAQFGAQNNFNGWGGHGGA